MKYTFLALLITLSFTACKKEPGEGGKAEIRGTIFEQRYNSNSGNPQGDPYPIAEQRVYIVYGDGTYPDDDTRTGPNGEYRFPWLRKGNYRIYCISECNAYVNCTEPIYSNIEIGDRKEVVTVPRMTIRNY
jgi:hypothetical protein